MRNIIKNFFNINPLGMNLRNFLISAYNPKASMLLAKDKSRTKRILSENGIMTPETIFEINELSEIEMLGNLPDEFVIKPSKGSGGSGILVLTKKDDYFVDPAGQKYSMKELIGHAKKILGGEYSGLAEKDTAIIEKRIFPSEKIIFKRAAGLPDIRIFCVNSVPVMSMMRYSTIESNGRANLSAGAIGLAIDIGTGKITKIHTKNKGVVISFEDIGIPKGYIVPKWEEIKSIAIKASKLSGLGIIGVDVVLDSDDNVMIIEINGRPGIEIQNINEKSLLDEMFFL